MGRTSPTVRDRLDDLEAEWGPFRRSLRRRRQPDFDRLFERARGHADAASQQNPSDPWRAFVMTVLIAQEAELREAIEGGRSDGDSGGGDRCTDGRSDDNRNDDGRSGDETST